ncbi:hypothetical protein V7D15_07135 [Thermoanaerobacter thermohydrosulfuricus]
MFPYNIFKQNEKEPNPAMVVIMLVLMFFWIVKKIFFLLYNFVRRMFKAYY